MTDAAEYICPDTGEIQVKPKRVIANKVDKYWASMRTNLNLVSRSKELHSDTYHRLKSELRDILDQGILSYPQTLSQVGLKREQTLEERKQALGLETSSIFKTQDEQSFLKDMANKAISSRKANWTWRIGEHADEMHRKGWYPFFVTLTISPAIAWRERVEPKDVWIKGRALRKYIRALCKVVTDELGHTEAHKPPYRPESDYVTYAGVIEHGKSREHHHCHLLVWLRAIPSAWTIDPNAGIRDQSKRVNNECKHMRTLWPWSDARRSPAMYFRCQGDIWEKVYNFVLPVNTKGPNIGKPMKVNTPRVAGAYVTKYMSKEHKEWHHRMKCTRNLGLTRLKAKIAKMETSVVEALTWRAENSELNHSLMRIHTVPLGLMRSIAKQEHFYRQYIEKRLDLKKLLTSNYEVFSNMLRSVRAGTRPERMDSYQFYDWVQSLLRENEGYSKKRQIAAHCALSPLFPRVVKRVEHVKLGGNEI